MQVKEAIPESFGLFEKQLKKRPFELRSENEVNAAMELETLYLENSGMYRHWVALPVGQKPGDLFHERCIENFKKLSALSLRDKDVKIAALGAVYYNRVYKDYKLYLEDRLDKKTEKQLDTLYENAENKFRKLARLTSHQDDEKANAKDMITRDFYQTNEQITNPLSRETLSTMYHNLLGQDRKTS